MSDRELVYRMRTCAAALADTLEPPLLLLRDAATLLNEAADALETPEPPGELMAILDANPAKHVPVASAARWGGLPEVVPRPCPKCGSIDARTVHRDKRQLMLTCPVCSYQWEYKP
jgi:hypothetical protein